MLAWITLNNTTGSAKYHWYLTVIANANDASGIAGTATITISNQSLGINEFDSKNISIYPNPVSNQLSFDVVESSFNFVFEIEKKATSVPEINAEQINKRSNAMHLIEINQLKLVSINNKGSGSGSKS